MARNSNSNSNSSKGTASAVSLAIGSAVTPSGGRFAGYDFVVTNVRGVRRGRCAGMLEVTLAPVGTRKPHGCYAVTCKMRRDEVQRRLEVPSTAYTTAQLEAAGKAANGTRDQIEERKEQRAAAGREKIGDFDRTAQRTNPYQEPSGTNIHVGDRVLVAYSNGARHETVAKVNWRTGKVAIVAPRNKSGVRWLPATLVRTVDAQARPLPCKLSANAQATLDAQGWVQLRFGSEFIERSYVVATTRDAAASNGTDYECASAQVYRDPDTGLYHRETGSFD